MSMLERFRHWKRHGWVVILGPDGGVGSSASGHDTGWQWRIHHCPFREAKRLPETCYPAARHVTITNLELFLRLLGAAPQGDEQHRIAWLDAAARRELGYHAHPRHWRFRGHLASGVGDLDATRRRVRPDDTPRARRAA
jgi:hypothetical protein